MVNLWNRMNLPNKLTMARFVLTLVFIGLATYPVQANGVHLIFWRWGFVLAIVAGITDFLDGYLARKYNLITNFGKLMDPLTDKIFTVSAFVMLTEKGVVPGWITVLILAREFAVTGLRTMAADKGHVMAASFSGKLKTMLQMLVLMLGGFIWVQWIPFLSEPYREVTWFWNIWLGLLGGIAAVTIYSGLEYYWKGRELYINQMR